MIRRIELPFRIKRPILACGADMKGAFAVAVGREAVLEDGFGDLADLDNFTAYEKAVKSRLLKMRAGPEVVACDLHPDYHSTRFAENLTHRASRITLYAVQHHEAHVASAIVDRALEGKVIGAAFDGTGYGSDGNIWGGEFFTGNAKNLKRAGRLEYVPMPGANKAISEPWRMAASYLGLVHKDHRNFKKYPVIKKMMRHGINSPMTSSAGRLFDAVGSILLGKDIAAAEAELPMELERIADPRPRDSYKFDIRRSGGLIITDPSKVIRGILADLSAGKKAGIISAKFHNTVAHMIEKTALILSKREGLRPVVLTGGVFQNRLLTARAAEMLEGKGFRVYVHAAVPANDSGIPIGQIAIANAKIK